MTDGGCGKDRGAPRRAGKAQPERLEGKGVAAMRTQYTRPAPSAQRPAPSAQRPALNCNAQQYRRIEPANPHPEHATEPQAKTHTEQQPNRQPAPPKPGFPSRRRYDNPTKPKITQRQRALPPVHTRVRTARAPRAAFRQRGLGGDLTRMPPVTAPAGGEGRIGAEGVVTGGKSGLPANGGKDRDNKIVREVACSFLAICPERRTMCRMVT